MQFFEINTREEKSIRCILYNAVSSDKVVVLAPAIGVLQSFYRDLAQFFQVNQISAITFDYPGIGESLHGNIKDENSDLGNWGSRDLNAVFNYAIEKFPNHEKILLGHSLGGQLIGLAPSSSFADKIILVAAQSGYWKFWKGSNRVKMWATWHLLFPIVTKISGYMPSGKFSRMENLPLNVAKEWSKWCRHKNYLFDYLEEDRLTFEKIKCHITSISIDDDLFAPKASVDWLSSKYGHAETKRLHLIPKDFKVSKIGHFSLFKKKFRSTIWEILLEEVKG